MNHIENNLLTVEQIASIANMSDKDIVSKMWHGDNDVWGYIYLKSVLPVVKKKHFFQILIDRKISRTDVYGMVFDVLICQKKLSLYEFRCPVIYWVRHYVMNVISEYCKKNDIPMSQDVAEPLLEEKEAPKEFSNDELVFAQKCFAMLWRKNPMRAYVHLLKIKGGLSAKQICGLLNISTEKNVAKILERAKHDIREIRNGLDLTMGERKR